MAAVGLKRILPDVFLGLGNGEKYLSWGYIPDVPVVSTGLIVKVGLTATNLLHDVDLVLSVNWLQLVNPMVDECGAKLYVPNAVHTALLQGDWLADHVQSGTVTVLSNEEDLQKMNEERMQENISILKCPKFWNCSKDAVNLKTNSFEGCAKYNTEWGNLYEDDYQICKSKNQCINACKHRNLCQLYVMKIEEGAVRINKIYKMPSCQFGEQ